MNARLNPLVIAMLAALAAPALVHAEPSAERARLLKPSDMKPAKVRLPSVEADSASATGAPGANPFGAPPIVPNAGSVLTAPATENANTGADALTVTNIGSGRAISGFINNAGNTVSAVRGTTNGGGAGINGFNSGTTGQAGKFQMTNAGSAQTGVTSTTVGTGNAIVGVNTNTGSFDTPAVLGQHNLTSGWGIGVEGDGGWIGVRAVGGNYGVSASGTSIGVYGFSAAGNGVYGGTSTGNAGYFAGPVYATGTMTAQSYALTSDRDMKQGFESVDTTQVLDRIAAMPIGSWDFKASPGIRHIGPMAQDFHAAFGLGADDKHIDVVDGIGVSLAAIQELQRQLKQRDSRIEALEAQAAQSASLAQTVQAMQSQIASLAQGQPVASAVVQP